MSAVCQLCSCIHIYGKVVMCLQDFKFITWFLHLSRKRARACWQIVFIHIHIILWLRARTRLIIRNQFFNYIRFTASHTHCSGSCKEIFKRIKSAHRASHMHGARSLCLLYGTKHKSIKFMVDKGMQQQRKPASDEERLEGKQPADEKNRNWLSWKGLVWRHLKYAKQREDNSASIAELSFDPMGLQYLRQKIFRYSMKPLKKHPNKYRALLVNVGKVCN